MGAPEHRRISGSRQRLFWAGQNIGQRIGSLLELRFLVFYPKTIIRSGFWSLLEMLPWEQIPPVNSFLLLVPAPIAIQGCHLWRRPTAGDCEPPPSPSSSAAGSRKRRLRPGTLPPSLSVALGFHAGDCPRRRRQGFVIVDLSTAQYWNKHSF